MIRKRNTLCHNIQAAVKGLRQDQCYPCPRMSNPLSPSWGGQEFIENLKYSQVHSHTAKNFKSQICAKNKKIIHLSS